VNGDISWPERIHGVDFQTVGIFLDDVVHFHPAKGTRSADDDTVFTIQGAQAMMHRASAAAQFV
jgi:hypothetical protein